jgi:hypothetical protein
MFLALVTEPSEWADAVNFPLHRSASSQAGIGQGPSVGGVFRHFLISARHSFFSVSQESSSPGFPDPENRFEACSARLQSATHSCQSSLHFFESFLQALN